MAFPAATYANRRQTNARLLEAADAVQRIDSERR
jgi:hypothetical protein